MHDTTALVRPAANDYTPADNPRFVKLHRRFPTVAYLRRHARRNVPSFAFEYMDGGAGADGGIARNWSAFDAVELVPRYGVTTALPPVGIDLFGRHYAAPVGVAPMGGLPSSGRVPTNISPPRRSARVCPIRSGWSAA
jgi:(S)-mandelate dehydrogenase